MIPAEARAIIESHQDGPPIDVMAVAADFGVKVYSARLAKDVSGVLMRDEVHDAPSGFVIFVDREEPSVRQRFTAAHELGHFVLHRDLIGDRLEDNYLLRSSGLSNRQEVEANKFAADLLMPWKLINAAMANRTYAPRETGRLVQSLGIGNVDQVGSGHVRSIPVLTLSVWTARDPCYDSVAQSRGSNP